MQNASSQATGEAMPADTPATDPALAVVRALPVNAASLVHDAINAMLARTTPPTVELELPRSDIVLAIATLPDGRTVMLGRSGRSS